MLRPSPKDIAAELEKFIRGQFQVRDDDEEFGRAVNLWEQGYVDSPGVVEVIGHLEETWNLTIPQEALFRPEFTCIDGMAATIAELLAGRT